MKKGFSGFWRGKGFYLALTLVIAGAATASFFAVNSMMTHFGTGDAQSRIDGEETTPWDTQSAQQAEKKQEDVPVSSSSSSASSAAPSDAASAPASPSPSYVWPVEGEVTQSFTGDELVYNETMGDWRTHNGIDVVSKFGGAVFSPSAGEVKLAQTDDALWGGVIEVQSGDVTLRFCGLDEVFVKEGDTLVQGDSIGVAGEVPAEAAAGAHLHVECMQGGQYIDPAKLFG